MLSNIYFYQAIKTLSATDHYALLYGLLNALPMVGITTAILARRGSLLQQTLITWLTGLMLLIFIPGLLAMPVLLLEDLTRVIRGFPP